MIEILGGDLDLAFKELNINAIKTYQGESKFYYKFQVWELNEDDFEKLCSISENDWKYEWG